MFLVPVQSPFNMRQYNLSVLRPPVSKSGLGSTPPKPAMSYKSAAQSLDLLRQNIQRSINQEIQTVISKYIDVSINWLITKKISVRSITYVQV